MSAPAGTLTPFGFSVYPDGTALITLAHSSQNGLFRDGAFTAVTAAGQSAPCWTTRVGKYVFTVNTASKTISRLIGTGSNVFVDTSVAAQIPGGAPTDIDADKGVLGVIDHGAGQSHLSLLTYNAFGELSLSGAAINLGVRLGRGRRRAPERPGRRLKTHPSFGGERHPEHPLLELAELVARLRRLLELEVLRVLEHLLLQRLDLA